MSNSAHSDFIRLHKYVICGDSNTGKSCLLWRFCDESFLPEHNATVGVQYVPTTLRARMQIWDTTGDEGHRDIFRGYLRGANAVFVVFALNNPQSFSHVVGWMKEIEAAGNRNMPVILVGNKCDLPPAERLVSLDEVMALAKQYRMTYVEASAKAGVNVQKMFMIACAEVNSRLSRGQYDSAPLEAIDFGPPPPETSVPVDTDLVHYQSPVTLALDMERALSDVALCDATIIAGENEMQEEIRVSRTILAARCPYFRSCFFGQFSEASRAVLVKSEVPASIMRELVRFLYCGKLTIGEQSVVRMIVVANEFGIQEVIKQCEKYISDRLEPSNVCMALIQAEAHNYTDLRSQCIQYVCRNADRVLSHESFYTLTERAVSDILSICSTLICGSFPSSCDKFRSEELQIDEDLIWRAVFAWARMQIPDQSFFFRPVPQWTEEEKSQIKHIISPLLPHIRILNISVDLFSSDLENTEILPSPLLMLRYKLVAMPDSIPLDHPQRKPRAGAAVKVLLAGLASAGKTSLLIVMKTGARSVPPPTVAFNSDVISRHGLRYTIWDLSGSEKMQMLWSHYYSGSDAIVYVVDSTDVARFAESALCLHRMIKNDLLQTCKNVLVLANKQDLPNAYLIPDITQRLRLSELPDYIRWACLPVSAYTGEGATQALEWLRSAVRGLDLTTIVTN